MWNAACGRHATLWPRLTFHALSVYHRKAGLAETYAISAAPHLPARTSLVLAFLATCAPFHCNMIQPVTIHHTIDQQAEMLLARKHQSTTSGHEIGSNIIIRRLEHNA